MSKFISSLRWLLLLLCTTACGQQLALNDEPNWGSSPDFKIKQTSVQLIKELDLLIFEVKVIGQAGNALPSPFGQMDGAPVLGYVFPTSLLPQEVGFSETAGIVALALTSHPDFDDTPLWDENKDRNYNNDGVIWHPHWVVLTEDKRVEGGLAVKQFTPGDSTVVLPPTNPGMPMYMDSPGYPVVTQGHSIKVLVPGYRIGNTDFTFDAVTAYMQVNASDKNRPMLGVYKVYSVASGDLSLPYRVQKN